MIPLLAALLGCAPDAPSEAAVYVAALKAPTYAEGWAACGRLVDPDRQGDCLTAVAERFTTFDDCDQVPEGRWRDECHFVAAETLGRRGDIDAAFAACARTGYRGQCEDHLLGLVAMSVVGQPFEAALAAWDSVRPRATDPRTDLHFWRAYWRNRVARALPIDASRCPPGACAGAGEQEVSAFVREQQRRTGEGFCAAPPPTYPWAEAALTREWIAAQHARGCGGAPPVEGPPRQR